MARAAPLAAGQVSQGMGHSSLQLIPQGGRWGVGVGGGGSVATSSGMAWALGRDIFPVTWQEGSMRQGLKVLETQSACVSLILRSVDVGVGPGPRRNSLCFRFGL